MDILEYFASQSTSADKGVVITRVVQDGDIVNMQKLLELGYTFEKTGKTYHKKKLLPFCVALLFCLYAICLCLAVGCLSL